TSRQTNLLIFLSPHVLASEEAVKTLSEEKLDLGRESMPPPEKDLLSPYRPQMEEPEILRRDQTDEPD
ncbi:MAG: hypothetical protein JRC92_12005, partial [Deltaproteobacteria bacterium]|nr:hypothetical protein [Deltaproteobacteria bacterium]